MYVDGIYDKDKDRILIAERVAGKRVFREFPADHVFYYDDPVGKFRTIFGTPCTRVATRSQKEFQKEVRAQKATGKRLYESDFKPIFRCLETNYRHVEAPKLNVAFFDIETDFDKTRGFAPTDEPFNRITAITVYLDWVDQLITLVMPPRHMSVDEANAIADKFENTLVFVDEVQMLTTFLDVIADADILSGWNSEGYDIPYLVNRITMTMSKSDTRRLCLWDQFPKGRMFERYGSEQPTFDLVGRVHMDYMQLYRKYTYEERHSYSLDAIGEYELNERKTPYEGTLDQLFNNDWKTFIEYNRQDVMIVAKLDKKLRFLDLANQLAHENTVLLPTTMGAVAVTEQAIINEAHDRGLVVQNRNSKGDSDESQAAGAYVAHPRKGLHEWIGSVDINSLYPSTIRALNMAPETIVGQIRLDLTDSYLAEKMATGLSFAAAWEGMFATMEYDLVMLRDRSQTMTVDWEDAGEMQMTGAEIWKLIFDAGSNLVITANGTIFSLDRIGVIPSLLERWYAERKQLQATLKKFINLNTGYDIPDSVASESDRLNAVQPSDVANFRALDFSRLAELANGNDLGELGQFMANYGLIIKDGKIYPKDKSVIADAIEYWDKKQHVKKINLNSLYGAILNVGCRFYDKRIGQSTTLSGRSITKSMTQTINSCIEGTHDHLGKSIIYGDTDSAYFSAWPLIKKDVAAGKIEWNKDIAVQLYDSIAEQVNEAFPGFMRTAFNCPADKGAIIKAGRELVATKGLFITKKRYALLYYDIDGKRKDKDGSEGVVKALGLDLKRSDTPKVVQTFLWDILTEVLNGHEKPAVIEKIITFKKEFTAKKSWEKGSPKRVNNLTKYGDLQLSKGKTTMPGHVRAALNWNTLREMNSDNYSAKIVDGMKVIICKLKNNPLGWVSVAYPTDELRLPKWFLELPFDDRGMEDVVVNQKIENLLGVLGWDLPQYTDTSTTFMSLFDFK